MKENSKFLEQAHLSEPEIEMFRYILYEDANVSDVIIFGLRGDFRV